MANLSTKIKMYAAANGVAEVDFMKDVLLQDDSDGKGAYIKEWNLDILRATRKAAYGDIGDQLDEIYKDIDAWKARIKSIKDNNPKV
jgi:hypothetical protein